MKGIDMKQARKATFNEIVLNSESESKRKIWERASLANQLAKMPQTHRSRASAYEAKQKALERAVEQGWALVKTDDFSNQELLSIEFSRRKRLHALAKNADRFAG